MSPSPLATGQLERTWSGLKGLLRLPQRFVLAEGAELVEAAASSTVRVGVKQGVLLMSGVATGATGASLRSACGDGVFNLLGYTWHHLRRRSLHPGLQAPPIGDHALSSRRGGVSNRRGGLRGRNR
jgi:hypothetical protein